MERQPLANVWRSFMTLLKLLAELAPGSLQRTQVEAAIRLAKSYTDKHEVVGLWGGFHGKTGGVMGLIGDEWKQRWRPLAPGTHGMTEQHV